MRAGLLNKQIQVKRPVVTTNTLGEQVMTYVDLYSTRARLVRHSRNRANVEDNMTMTNTITIQVRIYHDIKQNDIVIFDGVTYNVTSVMKLEQEQCIEVQLDTQSVNNDIEPAPEPTSTPTPEENEENNEE